MATMTTENAAGIIAGGFLKHRTQTVKLSCRVNVYEVIDNQIQPMRIAELDEIVTLLWGHAQELLGMKRAEVCEAPTETIPPEISVDTTKEEEKKKKGK